MNRKLELWLCKKALLSHCIATGQLVNLTGMAESEIFRIGEELLQARMDFEQAQSVVKRKKLPAGMCADNNCKDCFGEGYKVQVSDEGRKLALCHCVKREASPIIIMN